MSVATPYFDQLFAENDDPWAFRQRWYERRKRALTLALLTKPRYASIFEPGCANGELSVELAARCDRLLCCDTAAAAVALARTRLLGCPHAQVRQSRLPAQWPAGQYELIVLSELCYYLDADDLGRLIERALACLSADGQILACHWRPPIEGCPQTAEQVHALLDARLGMPRIASHHDHDFLLDLWSRDGTSVATLEGLR
ncbi:MULTISPECIES: SAM-dependent methyltransferase [Pseudomonas]|uniref:SAM-dependent methyltransferase n=1 Tax=Pseudomonas quebecensis TaxID=2995174 RepID=A0ABY6QMV6_9PSED|nr:MULTISPECIES: SAM-dependent methyltransferase [Pseudomonas]MCP1511290.1 cyclopropane fatty-acyl-phospholipid synthase-like methyltransferase [Pseudomonas rhodesiae]MCX4067599.1 SAM-dependent methyltransferase [Pseudomonas quebecensis]UZW20826.1 SAM-dependent methyltransferase [Pseudomonas quebecensis]UZW21757.1 SAM-dependent methyltransferase [Pseudomonas quebecensis]UZW26816.1 SAM-dependent methyltransferase [Pseudomonas quebecensis]